MLNFSKKFCLKIIERRQRKTWHTIASMSPLNPILYVWFKTTNVLEGLKVPSLPWNVICWTFLEVLSGKNSRQKVRNYVELCTRSKKLFILHEFHYSVHFLVERWKICGLKGWKEEKDGEVFISRQSRHFSFVNNINKALFPVCTLNWRVNKYVSRQGKGIKRRNKSTIII